LLSEANDASAVAADDVSGALYEHVLEFAEGLIGQLQTQPGPGREGQMRVYRQSKVAESWPSRAQAGCVTLAAPGSAGPALTARFLQLWTGLAFFNCECLSIVLSLTHR